MAFGEDTAERRAIVKANRNLSVRKLCEAFDHRKIPVPKPWKDAGIEWWTKAYQQRRFRSRVFSIVSKDCTRVDE
jgi:hypothetical protein